MPSNWVSLIERGESVIHVHQYSNGNGPVIPDTLKQNNDKMN